MKLTVARIVMRVVGTLAGLVGLSMLSVTPFLLHYSVAERNPWMFFWAAFPLALAAYFIYVAYLAWFRFSPLAVRHICGALGFFALMLSTRFFDPSRDSDTPWAPFAFLGCLVAIYIAYRVANARLSRWLFRESFSGAEP